MTCALVALMALTVTAQNKFCIAKDGKAATIVVDENDWKGVLRAVNDLSDDVRKVTGVNAEVAVANSQLSTFNSQLSTFFRNFAHHFQSSIFNLQ